MGIISVSLPADGTTADVADVNTPITTIVNAINGGLDNANITAGAAIATSKLADDGGITYSKVSTGFCIQEASTLVSAVATGTTLVPNDDTIPQNTEGDQYMSLAFTPKFSTSTLEIAVTLDISHSVGAVFMICSLFQDSVANALYTQPVFNTTATAPNNCYFTHTMISGTTSAITFKVRAGSSTAGTTTFNGQSGGRHFGATPKSSIIIKEYKV